MPDDDLIARIDALIAEDEPYEWKPVESTTPETYAGSYTFDTEASTLSVIAERLTDL